MNDMNDMNHYLNQALTHRICIVLKYTVYVWPTHLLQILSFREPIKVKHYKGKKLNKTYHISLDNILFFQCSSNTNVYVGVFKGRDKDILCT